MYFDNILIEKISSNTALVGSRETGKTTKLKKFVEHYLELKYTVVIIDSVTDHVDKSLLRYVQRNFKDILNIESPSKSEIINQCILEVNEKNFKSIFPYKIFQKREQQIIGIDVSKYLEEGYLTDDLGEREKIRLLYKKLVVQVLFILQYFLKEDRSIIIMDEVELLDEIEKIITHFNNKGIFLINSLHDESLLGKNKDKFKIYKDSI